MADPAVLTALLSGVGAFLGAGVGQLVGLRRDRNRVAVEDRHRSEDAEREDARLRRAAREDR